MNKIVHLWNEEGHPAFVKISYNNGKLSISGVVGPKRDGNAWGSSGQIIMSFKEFDARGHLTIDDVTPHSVNKETLKMFLEIWDKYHLNDMSPACEHQKAMGWDKEPFYPDRPTSDYITHPDGSKGWNMKGWIYPKDGGYLTKPCPVCGYKYGTAWKTHEVPAWAIEFLESLPDTDITPAWV